MSGHSASPEKSAFSPDKLFDRSPQKNDFVRPGFEPYHSQQPPLSEYNNLSDDSAIGGWPPQQLGTAATQSRFKPNFGPS